SRTAGSRQVTVLDRGTSGRGAVPLDGAGRIRVGDRVSANLRLVDKQVFATELRDATQRQGDLARGCVDCHSGNDVGGQLRLVGSDFRSVGGHAGHAAVGKHFRDTDLQRRCGNRAFRNLGTDGVVLV